MILEFNDIPILPKPQATTGYKHKYQKKSYHKYSMDLANIIRAKYNHAISNGAMPINTTKPILLHIYYEGKNTGDLSNIYKAVEDAVAAALDFNDRRVWNLGAQHCPAVKSNLVIQIQNIER
jgi:Holliday junction resolvase RusA-like endonuclease